MASPGRVSSSGRHNVSGSGLGWLPQRHPGRTTWRRRLRNPPRHHRAASSLPEECAGWRAVGLPRTGFRRGSRRRCACRQTIARRRKKSVCRRRWIALRRVELAARWGRSSPPAADLPGKMVSVLKTISNLKFEISEKADSPAAAALCSKRSCPRLAARWRKISKLKFEISDRTDISGMWRI